MPDRNVASERRCSLDVPVDAVVAPQSVVCLPMVVSGGSPVASEPIAVPPSWPALDPVEAVRVLHRAAAHADWTVLLDVTGAGGIGPFVPPADLLVLDVGRSAPSALESVYCASAVFVVGGPFVDLADHDSLSRDGDLQPAPVAAVGNASP